MKYLGGDPRPDACLVEDPQSGEGSKSFMMSSVIPARLEFSCGHAALVSLPRLKGESPSQRNERISREKTAARGRACDFCGPSEPTPLEVRPVEVVAVASGALNGHTPGVTRLGAEETRRTFPPRKPKAITRRASRGVAAPVATTVAPVAPADAPVAVAAVPVAPAAAPEAPATPVVAPVAPVATRRPRRTIAAAPQPAPVRRSSAPVVTRRMALRAAIAPTPKTTPPVRKRAKGVTGAALQRFEIQFRAEAIIQAADIRAALRQVESLGATDILAIVRQDK
jgi:hypothetical protein